MLAFFFTFLRFVGTEATGTMVFFFQVMPMALCVVFVAISGSRVGSGLIKSRGGSRGLLMSLERGVKMVRNSL